MSTISKRKNTNKKVCKSDSEDEDSEHELFYYANDRIKLMKEVLKLLKPKKIKSMAPECLKELDTEELNSMLLEELLGISKKRLKKIFEGQNNDDESSSESDEDPIDIISLDDITDDDDIGIVEISDGANASNKRHKHKKHRPKRIKVEKGIDIKKERDAEQSVASSSSKHKNNENKKSTDGKKAAEDENEKLLSVLELLELQARARAIKSQLLIEAENKQKAALEKAEAAEKCKAKNNSENNANESEDDAIIIDFPKEEEIVIPLSDSEDDNTSKIPKGNSSEHQKEIEQTVTNVDANIIDLVKEDKPKQPKFRIIRNRIIKPSMNLEGLTITVTNEKAKNANTVNIDLTENISDKCTNAVVEHKSPQKEIKEESLANVSAFIGPSLGPIEMIHLDTLDVDLDEIIMPEKETPEKEDSTKEVDDQHSEAVNDENASQNCSSKLSNSSKEANIDESSKENGRTEKKSDDKEKQTNISGGSAKVDNRDIVTGESEETEEGEINDDIEESDNDDVLQLDTVIDD